MRISPYLTFNGNCREAMLFYKKCLGGKLIFQTAADSPLSGKMPAKMKKVILQARLDKGELVIFGSDLTDEKRQPGNSVSLLLNCGSKEEIKRLFKKLSAAGEQTYQPKPGSAGTLSGELTDKYGNKWILHYTDNH
jgi:PhnB protein